MARLAAQNNLHGRFAHRRRADFSFSDQACEVRQKRHDILGFLFSHTSTNDSMKIHEYQAKAILAQYNVPVPRGEVAFTVEEAEAAAKTLGGSVVVKAQIHAGGRGKGGGVKVANDAAEAANWRARSWA